MALLPINGGGGEAGTLKNNFNASRAPLSSDNASYGYSAGSVWVYNAVTYTCVSIKDGSAVWRSEASTQYVDDWSAAVTWLLTGDHAGWFVVLANGNGAPDPAAAEFEGTSAARTASSVISDGGVATLQVVESSVTKYKVKCQARTVTNPVIKAIYGASTTTAQAFAAGGAGYYIWTALPSGAFAGMTANAVCYCNASGAWTTFQTYASAPNTILVGSGSQQLTYSKNAGTWWKSVSATAWASIAPTLIAIPSGTAPTPATSAVKTLRYRVMGDTLELDYCYSADNNTGAAAGNAKYGLDLSGILTAIGRSINTTVAPADTNATTGAQAYPRTIPVGNGIIELFDGTTKNGGPVTIHLASATSLCWNSCAWTGSAMAYDWVSSTWYAVTQVKRYVGFNAEIPLNPL